MTAALAVLSSPRADDRLRAATGWLSGLDPSRPTLVVGPSRNAAAEVVRSAATTAGAAFGWRPTTLTSLASELASLSLAARGLAPASTLAAEAVCARVTASMEPGELARFAPVADAPGLPRALARTLAELRDADVDPDRLPPGLRRVAIGYREALVEFGLADRSDVLRAAIDAVEAGDEVAGASGVGGPILLLDLAPDCLLEARLVAALVARSTGGLATVAPADDRPTARLLDALGVEPVPIELEATEPGSLARLQRHLFTEAPPPRGLPDDQVVVLSAPGESRESVEIARRIGRAAAGGVPFDQVAVLCRSPELYRPHLEEALRRAGIPAWFDRGARRPDPGGRALLALLACRAEGLSARRFAEYLSLGEIPDADASGAPPPALDPAERWVPPHDDEADEDELSPEAAAPVPARPADVESAPVLEGSLRVPRRWERLLVDAVVIGGLDRWRRRLAGLRAETERRAAEPEIDEASKLRHSRRLVELRHLEGFAIPLLEQLDSLPTSATWGAWIESLGDLATRAIRQPERLLALLGALRPMADIGPVDLTEVRIVLARRLTDLVSRPEGRRFGRVFVGPVESARGLSFDVVFVPGLAERLFPRKVVEDPVLLDSARRRLDDALLRSEDRVAAERTALRLAVGAARTRVVLSWPRIDSGASRPRVPSFYGLEVLRAAEGRLPGFGELSERADAEGAARISWPAPEDPREAIDDAEHDISLFFAVRRKSQQEAAGTMRYLLKANAFLARSLRARYARWSMRRFTPFDGLVGARPEGRAGLDDHQIDRRSFSATALQDFAACPYRFFLRTVCRLSPREVPEPLEYIDPLSRGSLIHDVQFELLTDLRKRRMLPIDRDSLSAARDLLDSVLDRVAGNYAEKLAPAIPRVWNDAIGAIRTDLREWLRRVSLEPSWIPHRFELAFGLHRGDDRDEHSRVEPVPLDSGLLLRGAIDLVERSTSGTIRVTDHKTGRARVQQGSIVKGGEALQPVLYALAAEKLFEGAEVESGRLWYCTTSGGYAEAIVPLDDKARRAADILAATLQRRLSDGDLPAFPRERACDWCDYTTVCGPHEQVRNETKSRAAVEDLVELRGLR